MRHTLTYYIDKKRATISFGTAEEALIFGLLLGYKIRKVYESHTFFAWFLLFRGKAS